MCGRWQRRWRNRSGRDEPATTQLIRDYFALELFRPGGVGENILKTSPSVLAPPAYTEKLKYFAIFSKSGHKEKSNHWAKSNSGLVMLMAPATAPKAFVREAGSFFINSKVVRVVSAWFS